MSKRVRRVAMVVLLAVFLFSGGYVLYTMQHYREEEEVYILAADTYVQPAEPVGDTPEEDEKEKEYPPITVDFESLLEKCSDIVGWIYCEDTPINYPIVRGKDNDYYLRRSYDGTPLQAGTIFMDASNMADFSDSNTIIYGHHMRNGSMFAVLDQWMEQEFYEEHPVMWLLTPGGRDYKIVLFSGYTTPAVSDTYVIYRGAGTQFDEYLSVCKEKSDFEADVELDREGQYVLLSTCVYVYTDARFVLHGMLVPVENQ